MGGTSCDVSLAYEGQSRVTKDWFIEFGYPIRFPSIEVLTIGAGGGSLAWIDEAGGLRNGPQSAGADPGPACYGHGNTVPTNTDANGVGARRQVRTAQFLPHMVQRRTETGLASRIMRLSTWTASATSPWWADWLRARSLGPIRCL